MRWQHSRKKGYEWWKYADFLIEERLKNVGGAKVPTFFLFVGGKFHNEYSTMPKAATAAINYTPRVM